MSYKSTFDFLLIFLAILCSGSLYYTGYNDDLFLIVFFAVSIVAYIITGQFKLSKVFTYYAIFGSLYLLIHVFATDHVSHFNTYLGYMVRIFIFLLVYSFVGQKRFAGVYVQIMLTLAFLNMIVYVDHVFLLNLSESIADRLPQLRTWNNHPHDNFVVYFSPSFTTSTASLIKNPGIFWEGGAYQYFLNLALIFNIYARRKALLSFPNILLIATIISTFSTIGYIILGAVLASTPSIKSFSYKINLKTLLVVPLVIFLMFSSVIVDKFFNKQSQNYKSTSRRILDAQVELSIISSYPLMGIGLGNNEKWVEISQSMGGGRSSSNGILNYASKLGIFGLLVTLYPIFLVKMRSRESRLVVLCTILTSLSQNIILTPVFLLSIAVLEKREST